MSDTVTLSVLMTLLHKSSVVGCTVGQMTYKLSTAAVQEQTHHLAVSAAVCEVQMRFMELRPMLFSIGTGECNGCNS